VIGHNHAVRLPPCSGFSLSYRTQNNSESAVPTENMNTQVVRKIAALTGKLYSQLSSTCHGDAQLLMQRIIASALRSNAMSPKVTIFPEIFNE
jgi:hypothetical protein